MAQGGRDFIGIDKTECSQFNGDIFTVNRQGCVVFIGEAVRQHTFTRMTINHYRCETLAFIPCGVGTDVKFGINGMAQLFNQHTFNRGHICARLQPTAVQVDYRLSSRAAACKRAFGALQLHTAPQLNLH